MEITKGSRKDYYPIGAVMQRKNGKCYEVVAGAGCASCTFDGKHNGWCDYMKCDHHFREDGVDVIFIRRKDLESADD